MSGTDDSVSLDAGTQDARFIRGLLRPQAYNHATQAIHLLETHCAWVLLTGPFAYKIKKPVNFGFLDYSTLEKRRFNCEEELRLNRRFAADIYLAVVSITGTETDPHVDGKGSTMEYAVKMLQFPEQGLLSRLADEGKLDSVLIDQVIEQVAGFHQAADVAPAESGFGEPEQIYRWITENFIHIRTAIDYPAECARLDRIQAWVAGERTRLEPVLVERKRHGFIRECHGDLHLGNMTLIDGRVTLFDCIEFNPELRWIDVISEAAFVMMDLEDRGFAHFANRFINGYLQQTGDYDGLQLLRWYMVYRTLVRAKVAVLRSLQQGISPDLVRQLQTDCSRHLQLAESYMKPAAAALLLMHGLSGSGKTTAAQWLCEKAGMIQLRSDVERKRLSGMAPLERTAAALAEDLYTEGQTERTYCRLLELAAGLLRAGYTVIVDATFLKRKYRQPVS